jgi:hypothetical protein
MQNPTFIRPLAAALLCGLALSACGSDDPTGEPAAADRESANRDAMLAYAKCMRDNGVDMPDPQLGPNGEVNVTIGGGAGGPIDRTKMQAAQEACQGLMEGAFGEPQELTPEQKDAMLAYASCMRDEGIDMPDPQFETGGAVMIGRGPDGGGQGPAFDPQSAEFQAADETCRAEVGDFGRGPGGGPGFSTQGGPGGATEAQP